MGKNQIPLHDWEDVVAGIGLPTCTSDRLNDRPCYFSELCPELTTETPTPLRMLVESVVQLVDTEQDQGGTAFMRSALDAPCAALRLYALDKLIDMVPEEENIRLLRLAYDGIETTRLPSI